MVDKHIGISEAIEALRSELTQSVRLGRGQRMQFGLGPIELSLEATVTKGADGKINWWIVEAGGKRESTLTQTVTLMLTPTWTKLDGTLTTDFLIADVSEPSLEPDEPIIR
jgi:hypothetical protein